MKRLLMAVSMVIGIAGISNAQLRWGAEAGMNVVTGSDTDKTRMGFNVGATAEYSFSRHWFLNTSLKLSSQPCGFDSWWDYYYPTGGAEPPKYNDKGSYTPYYLVLPIRAGYGLALNPNVRISFAIGPSIGVGLFGKGNVKSVDYSSESMPAVSHHTISNVFDKGNPWCLSSSRFEAGANARVELELRQHYAIGVEYDIKHICGGYKANGNVGMLSFNLGYRF